MNSTIGSMFNSVISEETEVIPHTIYRHFKGGYYLVLAVAYKESERDQEKKEVVYQSLKDGVVWTRDLEVFTSDIPKERSVTGQTKRFVRVDHFENQLSSIPTNILVEELSRRSDNPYVGVEPLKDVFIDEYISGYFTNRINRSGETDTVFNKIAVHSSLEEALDYARGKVYMGKPVQVVRSLFIPISED